VREHRKRKLPAAAHHVAQLIAEEDADAAQSIERREHEHLADERECGGESRHKEIVVAGPRELATVDVAPRHEHRQLERLERVEEPLDDRDRRVLARPSQPCAQRD
jgi:hypothetical protein